MKESHHFANKVFSGELSEQSLPRKDAAPTHLKATDAIRFVKGAEIYAREGHCATCHQADGQGLPASGFPPISGTRWTQGNPDRLIKLTLHGLIGPMEVAGRKYPGQVPMTPFGSLLTDEEIASVLTYFRNSFGNQSSAITPAQVKAIRQASQNKVGPYRPEEILRKHPLE